jgi:hypothetical protein
MSEQRAAKISGVSILLLVVQLALLSSIAAKYLYQRSSCPRVWTRTVAIDPESPMRGRYLALRLAVDGCQSTLPTARQAQFPRNFNGMALQGPYSIAAPQPVSFPAQLAATNGKLTAIRIPTTDGAPQGQIVLALPGLSCDAMWLADSVNFYIAEHAQSPLPLRSGAELWIEVTVPPKGPPRPIQLALKENGIWKPFAFR